MTTVNVYLTFSGNCEEAFTFYKSVFGGEFLYVGKWGQQAFQDDTLFISDNKKDKIMHITLPISKETMLMGNDSLEDGSAKAVSGDFTLSIKTDKREEADKLFARLSEGGHATMPMKEVFWGSYYGMVTDKFGVHWKLNVDTGKQ